MGISAANLAFAAVPIYIAIKYRLLWFDTNAPSAHGVVAGLVIVLVSWATLLAPETCGDNDNELTWAPGTELAAIITAAAPVVAGKTLTPVDGSTTVAVFVAVKLVADLGIANPCSIGAVVAAAGTAAATIISAAIPLVKHARALPS